MSRNKLRGWIAIGAISAATILLLEVARHFNEFGGMVLAAALVLGGIIILSTIEQR